jgi:hypothetical protein
LIEVLNALELVWKDTSIQKRVDHDLRSTRLELGYHYTPMSIVNGAGQKRRCAASEEYVNNRVVDIAI